MRRVFLALLVGGPLALAPLSVAADRPPSAEERAAIEEVLRAEGYTSWDEIEWDDDGYWEVDDAVAADGEDYDLKLDADYRIIERDD